METFFIDYKYTLTKRVLSHTYKKTLINMLTPVWKYIKNHPVKVEAKKKSANIDTNFFKKTLNRNLDSISQENLVKVLDQILCVPENRALYLKMCGEGHAEAWKLIEENQYAKKEDIEELVGREINIGEADHYYYYWSTPEYVAPFSLCHFASDKGGSVDYFLYFPDDLRCLLLLGKHAWLDSDTQAPPGIEIDGKDENFIHFSGQDIFPALNWLEGIYNSRQLELSGQGKLTQAKMNKVVANIPIENYPLTYDPTGYFCNWRKKLSVMAFAYLRPGYIPMGGFDPLKFLKFSVEEFKSNTNKFVDEMLPTVDGIKLSLLKDSYAFGLIGQLNDALREQREGEYQSVDDLLVYIRWSNYLNFFDNRGFNRAHIREASVGEDVNLDNLGRLVTRQLIAGYAMYLAAMGLAEIVIDGKMMEEVRALDNDMTLTEPIRYVSLTPAGRYAFGIGERPEIKSAVNEFRYELDEDSLIIRSLAENNPYDVFLQSFANPIGTGRFIFDETAFIKECNSPSDIEKKIKTFRQSICDKLPKNWEDFFAEMRRKASAVTPWDGPQMVLEKIDPEDRNLQRIIATDPDIRKYTIRADNFTLLIESAHYDAVKKRLKTFGYLLP